MTKRGFLKTKWQAGFGGWIVILLFIAEWLISVPLALLARLQRG